MKTEEQSVKVVTNSGQEWIIKVDDNGKLQVEKQNQQDDYVDYSNKNRGREGTLNKGTKVLENYLIESEGFTPVNAKIQVTLLSREITAANGGAKLDYILGDKQPLIDLINASTLISADAKLVLIGVL